MGHGVRFRGRRQWELTRNLGTPTVITTRKYFGGTRTEAHNMNCTEKDYSTINKDTVDSGSTEDSDLCCYINQVDLIISDVTQTSSNKMIENLERILENVHLTDDFSTSNNNLVINIKQMKKPDDYHLYANLHNTSDSEGSVMNHVVEVHLPKALMQSNRKNFVFCMYKNKKPFNNDTVMNEFVVGVSLGNSFSTLEVFFNISFVHQTQNNMKMKHTCMFWSTSDNKWNSSGCNTILETNKTTCQCNHMTYFAVLLNPYTETSNLISLTYITQVGSTISIVCLVLTLIMYVIYRKSFVEHSTQIHINLAIALLLLNINFLLNVILASLNSVILCVFAASALHYFLLCTFTWMAIEALHLYRLLCKVYNTYMKRYIQWLCLLGWGFPGLVVISILFASINQNIYGQSDIPSKDTNYVNYSMCYITEKYKTVHYVTNLGYFALTFTFTSIMLGITVYKIYSLNANQRHQESRKVWKDMCTVLGLTSLLGTTWGIIFFTFSQPIALPALYLFCILNSMHGLFIFLWFYCSKKTASKGSSGTNTQDSSRL
ncbi:adhesion G protein-coupled receptor G3-like [Erpetoichthys calabaricus]|uniref:adhesion G protein-coupled receptor G3-like n=1 Tax=Erpetoichthys calabaricus TaxID=27687 RepID=UPI0022348AC1|nr:adhesion G protein-coupled receptor G3-like [Erpetoichthys calabaricus]